MKVLIVASGFVQQSRRPIEILQEAGFTVEEREYGLAGLNQNEDEFCRIIKGADALVVTGMDRVTRRVMASADRLKMIAIRSSGFEGTDIKAATDHGIAVTHNPGANKEPVAYDDFAREHGIRKMPFEELLQESDVVTLQVPLDETTRKVIGPKEIRRMKAEAILINTCRGPVVDEEALLAALKSGHLYGYGTDVYNQEPPQNLELVRLDNVISTPHVGGITEGGLMGLAMATVTKIVQYLKEGIVPENLLNPEVLADPSTRLPGPNRQSL